MVTVIIFVLSHIAAVFADFENKFTGETLYISPTLCKPRHLAIDEVNKFMEEDRHKRPCVAYSRNKWNKVLSDKDVFRSGDVFKVAASGACTTYISGCQITNWQTSKCPTSQLRAATGSPHSGPFAMARTWRPLLIFARPWKFGWRWIGLGRLSHRGN